MFNNQKLPAEFIKGLASLEDAYLLETDPIKQSGFHGGADRWRIEREPLLDAVENDGDFLDIGCANGYLLECLVEWAKERNISLNPYGIDQGAKLIQLTKDRFPGLESHFHIANTWDWEPDRKYRYVYTLYDYVPESFLEPFIKRLLDKVVEPNGRLIVGAYNSRSRGIPLLDIGEKLSSFGLNIEGSTMAGAPPASAFAWLSPRQ
jgi:hypothetical protein